VLTVARTSPPSNGNYSAPGNIKVRCARAASPGASVGGVGCRPASGRSEGHWRDDEYMLALCSCLRSHSLPVTYFPPRLCVSALLSSVLTSAMVAHYGRNAHVAIVARYVRNGGRRPHIARL